MQQFKTITKKTTTKVESVHVDVLYAVIENCYNSLQVVEADGTSAVSYTHLTITPTPNV